MGFASVFCRYLSGCCRPVPGVELLDDENLVANFDCSCGNNEKELQPKSRRALIDFSTVSSYAMNTHGIPCLIFETR